MTIRLKPGRCSTEVRRAIEDANRQNITLELVGTTIGDLELLDPVEDTDIVVLVRSDALRGVSWETVFETLDDAFVTPAELADAIAGIPNELPDFPAVDGTYTLQLDVVLGVPTLSWV